MKRALAGIATVGTIVGLVATAPSATAGKPAPPPPSPTSTVEFQNATYSAGESIGFAPIRIVRTKGDATKDAWVTVGSSNGTAVSPADYTDTPTANIKMPAGTNTVDFLVPIVDDAIDENAETVNLTLYSFTSPDPLTMPAAQLGKRKTAKLTIVDNDAAPTLTVADDSTNEGNSENFGVTLSAVSGLPVTFTWGTAQTNAGAPKDATSGVDYTAFAGQTATIPAGQTFKNIAVGTIQDAIYEDNQTFKMVVSSAPNATIVDGTGVGTIIDNDSAPVLSIANAGSVWENAGPYDVVVTKTGASELPASAHLTTTDGDATPGACGPGDDYTQLVDQLVTVPGGAPSVNVPVTICNDAVAELNETFAAYLIGPTSAATINGAAASQLVTIKDDEPATLTTTASANSAPVASPPDNTNVDVTALVKNMSGDPLNGQLVRYEVYRDTTPVPDGTVDLIDMTGPGGAAFAYTGSGAAAGGASIPAVDGEALLGPANGAFIGYTNYAQPRLDTVVACVVPDFVTPCGVVADDGDSPDDLFTGENTTLSAVLPTVPWDYEMVAWTP